jgi:hypothetical protein
MNAAQAVLIDTVMLLGGLCFAFALLCLIADWLHHLTNKDNT